MRAGLRATLAFGLCLMGFAHLHAGTIPLPSDVSVSLTAEPHNDLLSGQRIAFTIAVTNNGPEAAASVMVGSSPIVDELDVNTATSDCGNTLGLAVVDLGNGFYYQYSWFPTIDLVPLGVGETRYCHLSLEFTGWAPETFSLTFSMPDFLVDLDPSNNSSTVTLQRASQGAATATPVPTLSPFSLMILGGLLAFLAGVSRAGVLGLEPRALLEASVKGLRKGKRLHAVESTRRTRR